jgi:hypothetical protein
MKHIEIDGKEIVVANINGKYYALDDIDVVTQQQCPAFNRANKWKYCNMSMSFSWSRI